MQPNVHWKFINTFHDLQDENNREDGFIDRMLFSYPEPANQQWTDAEVSEEATQQARECFEKLLELEHNPTAVGRQQKKTLAIWWTGKAF